MTPVTSFWVGGSAAGVEVPVVGTMASSGAGVLGVGLRDATGGLCSLDEVRLCANDRSCLVQLSATVLFSASKTDRAMATMMNAKPELAIAN
jgi:hypothetical protein